MADGEIEVCPCAAPNRVDLPPLRSGCPHSQHELKQWVQEKVDAEVSRAVGLGQRIIKLPVKNCAIVRQDKGVVNRVEVDTGFNFDQVVQILLSEPQQCPKGMKVSAGIECRIALQRASIVPSLVLRMVIRFDSLF